ncbi:MAG: hypothetical protein HQL07_19480 [Nitrospirae bacterium]|nr:hypothetical protein [Magnetococcales bacterium]HAT50576.1 hypothetical protein [Alphaproteobacteria bacterium]
MSIFDLELPKKDLDPLEDQLRLQVGRLSEESRRRYYATIKPLIRDPDTYAVLCWSLGLGLHHVYLRRWWSFLLDLATSVGIYLILVIWMIRGELLFPILLTLGVVLNVFDTFYHAILSQRIVQEHNIRLCQSTLESLAPPTTTLKHRLEGRPTT